MGLMQWQGAPRHQKIALNLAQLFLKIINTEHIQFLRTYLSHTCLKEFTITQEGNKKTSHTSLSFA